MVINVRREARSGSGVVEVNKWSGELVMSDEDGARWLEGEFLLLV